MAGRGGRGACPALETQFMCFKSSLWLDVKILIETVCLTGRAGKVVRLVQHAVFLVRERFRRFFSSSLLLSSLELSDTRVYEPWYEPSSESLHISAKQLFLG